MMSLIYNLGRAAFEKRADPFTYAAYNFANAHPAIQGAVGGGLLGGAAGLLVTPEKGKSRLDNALKYGLGGAALGGLGGGVYSAATTKPKVIQQREDEAALSEQKIRDWWAKNPNNPVNVQLRAANQKRITANRYSQAQMHQMAREVMQLQAAQPLKK